jgi:hypothetical protein
MAEQEIRHPDGRIEHPSVRHEKSDASLRWVLGLLLGAMVLAVIIFGSISWFFHDYNAYQSNLRRSAFPLAPDAQKRLETLPPEPRLEQVDRLRGSEASNGFKREQAQQEILGSYGPLPGEEGFIHVPIDVAMKYLAGKLPARAEKTDAEAHDNGLVDGGQPNSGRMFRRKPRWSGQ